MVFDGDYATTTVATGDFDPLQPCVEAIVAYLVHDRWLVRRLPTLVTEAGFEMTASRSYGYVESSRARLHAHPGRARGGPARRRRTHR